VKLKILTHGIMAAFVSQAILGCTEEPTTQVSVYGSISECILGGNSHDECQKAWNEVQQANVAMAPRFTDMAACQETFGNDCQVQQVQNSDGSFSDVMIPAMAGMAIGALAANAMNSNTPTPPPQPMYQTEEEKKRRKYGGTSYVPKYTNNSGAMFNSGKQSVPFTKATPSKPSPKPIARGGFGRAGAASVGG